MLSKHKKTLRCSEGGGGGGGGGKVHWEQMG